MKLLVTGAAGFIGARFVEACQKKSYSIISVDEPSYFSSRAEHRNIQFGKIVDRSTLFDWLKKHRPELNGIVHLGACTDTTEMDEQYLTRMNLEYSQSIWEYASQNKIPLVYASSAATYGDGNLGYDDAESRIVNLKPLNPYGESKRLFDLWALGQEKEGVTPPSWSAFKFFNVYGFGERHKGKMASVVLHAFDQIQKTGKTRLFKSHRLDIAHGHQKRDFIFVEDIVNVLFYALEKPIRRGIYNLGTGQARTFLDLVRPVFSALKKPENIEFIDTPVAIRDRYQYFTEAKIERLRAEGCTNSFTSLEGGVSKYVQELLLKEESLSSSDQKAAGQK
ncbi:MAG: ADP-glyceromanno-heptose 6-epimerase [Deltaproteobacteria bacterium]|nr:ADP-glyceromanno-heptose 6-epimerase [Deltaproteobacteria bacterium]